MFIKEGKRPLLGEEEGWDMVRTRLLPTSSLKDTSRLLSYHGSGGSLKPN